MFLEAEEFDGDDTEEENDEFRPGPAFAVALTAGVTVLDEGGAGAVFLIDSPAVSTSVLLFGIGSGTGRKLSETSRMSRSETYDWKGHAFGPMQVVASRQRSEYCSQTKTFRQDFFRAMGL